jgi:hypothetical protein
MFVVLALSVPMVTRCHRIPAASVSHYSELAAASYSQASGSTGITAANPGKYIWHYLVF